MSNPVITENAAGSNYSVSDSVRVHATLALTMLIGEANFDVSFPVAAAPTVSLHGAGGMLPLTVPAAVEQAGNIGGTRPIHWSTFDVGPTCTLHVRVEDTTFTAVNEAWTIKVSALPLAAITSIVTGSNATINLVEADPIIQVLTPAQNKLENQPATLQAKTRRNTIPLPGGPGCAGVTMTWTQDGGDTISAIPGATSSVATVFGAIPGCQGEATVNLPGLTASVVLHYTFSVTIGEFSDSGTAVVNAATRIRHSVLVIDRSGSMLGDKWNNAVKAAHIWLDLLTAFRRRAAQSQRPGRHPGVRR